MIPLLLDYNYSPLIQIEATYVSSWQETGAVAEQKCPLDFFSWRRAGKMKPKLGKCQYVSMYASNNCIYIVYTYTYIYIYTMWETH